MKKRLFADIKDRYEDFEMKSKYVKSVRKAILNCSEDLANFVSKPTFTRGALLSFKILQVINSDENRRVFPFQGAKWKTIYDDSIADLLFSTLQHPKMHDKISYWEQKNEHNELSKFIEYKNKVTFGACFSHQNSAQSYIYYKDATHDEVREIIHEIFWDVNESKCVNLQTRKIADSYDKDRHFYIKSETNYKSLFSKTALYEAQKIKKALDLNISRSILYYGNPGTGKSTICNNIIEQLQLKTVKIKFSDLTTSDIITQLIEALMPEAIIIDDIDRSQNDVLINFLEHIKNYTKLVLATANNKDDIDGACLRPGRFDDIVEINKLDEDVVRSVLGPENEEFFEVVKFWPIAYINELVTRIKIMPSRADVIASLKDLHMRIKSIQSGTEANIEDEILQSLST